MNTTITRNTRDSYNGEAPPCDTCIARRNCRNEMSCNLFVSWTNLGAKAKGDQIPTRAIYALWLGNGAAKA